MRKKESDITHHIILGATLDSGIRSHYSAAGTEESGHAVVSALKGPLVRVDVKEDPRREWIVITAAAIYLFPYYSCGDYKTFRFSNVLQSAFSSPHFSQAVF